MSTEKPKFLAAEQRRDKVISFANNMQELETIITSLPITFFFQDKILVQQFSKFKSPLERGVFDFLLDMPPEALRETLFHGICFGKLYADNTFGIQNKLFIGIDPYNEDFPANHTRNIIQYRKLSHERSMKGIFIVYYFDKNGNYIKTVPLKRFDVEMLFSDNSSRLKGDFNIPKTIDEMTDIDFSLVEEALEILKKRIDNSNVEKVIRS